MSREARSSFCRLSVNEVTSCPCWELEWSKRSCAGLGKHSFASPVPEHLRNLQNWLGCQKWVSLDLYSLCRDKFYGSANRKRFKTTALDQKCFSRSCFFLPLSGSRCWNIQQNSFSLFFFLTHWVSQGQSAAKKSQCFPPSEKHPIATLNINWEKSLICSLRLFWFFNCFLFPRTWVSSTLEGHGSFSVLWAWWEGLLCFGKWSSSSIYS